MSTIGGTIDTLYALREQKRKLEESIKQLEGKISVIEETLIAQMDAEGVTKSTGAKATASTTLNIRPNVENWDLFYGYIHKNKYFHLLERRPSVSGCQELFETKGKIPGVVPFAKRKLNLRSI